MQPEICCVEHGTWPSFLRRFLVIFQRELTITL
jgi:hypothetical protein